MKKIPSVTPLAPRKNISSEAGQILDQKKNQFAEKLKRKLSQNGDGKEDKGAATTKDDR